MRFTARVALALLILAPCAHAEKIKVSTDQLQEQLQKRHVTSSINERGVAWMVVNHPGGTRELYWNTFASSNTWQGSGYIEGDKLCSVYKQLRSHRASRIHRMKGSAK